MKFINIIFKHFISILIITLFSVSAYSKGNLASQPTRLDVLFLSGKDLSMSNTEYSLETGKYYKLSIENDGYEEFMFQSHDLFRNSWISQIIVNEIEMHSAYPYGIEFDDEGVADIWFVPIRPGRYEFGVKGFEDKGMKGFFNVE